MRFLLHPPKASTSILAKSKKTIPLGTNTNLNVKTNNNDNPNNKNSSEVYQTFGQQCSPNCGCAVRFEATYDPSGTSNNIISMSYDAKTVVSTVHRSAEDGLKKLVPVYTISGSLPRSSSSTSSSDRSSRSSSRPMLKECKCQTVHSLAQRIIESMSKMSLSQAKNQLEFVGVRSSPAFRYTVLKNHGLLKVGSKNRTNASTSAKSQKSVEETILNVREGHCFDLVEDALVACLNGYMPQPRRHTAKQSEDDMPIKSPKRHMDEVSRHTNVDSNKSHGGNDFNGGLDPLRFVNAAKKRTAGLFYQSAASSSSMSNSGNGISGSGSNSSAMPPFHLMGNESNDNISHDTLSQLRMEIKSLQEEDRKKEELNDINMLEANDWLSYVDEGNCE